jgi:hypothetical protein
MPLSKTESVARALLRHYLPRERFQYNVRPDWLKYPPTGRNLELDIYLPERHIAIEIDGVQHGRYIAGMQKDFTYFITQQRRDMFKLEACQHRGVTLYRLTSFDLTQRRFEPFIRQLMTESEWRRTTPPLHLYKQAEKLSRMKAVKSKRPKPGLLKRLLRLT